MKDNETYKGAMNNFQDNWNVSFLKDFQTTGMSHT
jgi:hypothetical protein